ncbi:MAG: hypothetical protein ACE5JO_04465 [Candidatus Binatia bacterium]
MADGRWPLPWSLLLSLLFLFSSCAETDLQPVPTPPPLSFKELKEKVSRIRGLPFQHEVTLETKSTEEIQALLEKSLFEEHSNESLAQVARVYTRLGLLPEATDLSKALVDLHLFQQGVHYDSLRKKIILPQEPLKPYLAFLRSPWSANSITKQLLLTHALTHALQEQHFHWEEKIKDRDTEDRGLALRALAKGDAVLVGLAHLMGDPNENKQKILDGIQGLIRLAAQIDEELPHLPELLRQKAAFQYLQGSQFVMWAYSLKGWEGVNRLFAHPPISTEQLLHPEKYYEKRDDPVRITPWGLIRQLGRQKIMDETLGEFLIRILLRNTLSEEEAAQAAAGWAGDSLLAFQQGEELILGWVTAWDDREEALEFYRGYRRALEERYEIFLEPTPASATTLITALQSDHPLLLQIRGNFVFFLDGIPSPQSVEIAEGLWKELETGTESLPVLFDLVSHPRQPFFVMR